MGYVGQIYLRKLCPPRAWSTGDEVQRVEGEESQTHFFLITSLCAAEDEVNGSQARELSLPGR